MAKKYYFTIGKKIFLSFSLILSLLVFIVSINFFRVKRIRDLNIKVEPVVAQMKVLNSFNNSLFQMETVADRFFITRYEEQHDQLEKILDSMNIAVVELVAHSSDNEMQVSIKKLKNALSAFEGQVSLVFEYGDKAEKVSDRNLIVAKAYESMDLIKNEYSNLSDNTFAKMANNIESQKLLIAKTQNQFLIFALIIIAFGILLSILLTISLSRPIKKLRNIVKKVSGGNFNLEIKIHSHDEIGELAYNFSQMLDDLKKLETVQKNYSKSLELKVGSKTHELNATLELMKEDKTKMQQQRLATLNILEDVSDSQKNLKKAYKELERKSRAINTLKNVNSDLTGVLNIEEAVDVIIGHLKNNFHFLSLTFLIYDDVESGIVYRKHLFKSFCASCLDIDRNDLEQYLKVNTKLSDKSVLSVIDNVQPKYTGAKIDNNIKKVLKKFQYYPLISGKKVFGVMQVSNLESDVLGKDEKELLLAVVSAFILSLERLQILVLAQQSKTASLVESLRDGVIMFNVNEDLVIMNKAFSQYTGFSKKYFNMQDLYNLIPNHNIAKMVKTSIHKGAPSIINEVELLKKHYEIMVLPVNGNDGKTVGGAIIFHDNTRLKEIDQMKTEFLSVASHQLRTPLTAIKLFTEMLVKGDVGKLNNNQQEYLENVHESTERMVRLVNDLLNVTRIESGRLSVTPQPVDIEKFIKSVISEAELLIDSKMKKIIFEKDKTGFDKIPLDENLMRQVIHNLVVNAIRYSSKEDGLITVKLWKKDDQDFIISVKDNGIGIPESSQKRIFEKFYRADNAIKSVTEGTGLGLYVSKMIVVSSEGKIWFKSEQNKGTEFFVQLPITGMKEKKGERGLAIS